MTERQIGLYHEFRDAVDFSLESPGVGDGAHGAGSEDEIADRGMRMGEALDFYTDQIDAKLDEATMAAEDMSCATKPKRTICRASSKPCSPAVGRCHARANEGTPCAGGRRTGRSGRWPVIHA